MVRSEYMPEVKRLYTVSKSCGGRMLDVRCQRGLQFNCRRVHRRLLTTLGEQLMDRFLCDVEKQVAVIDRDPDQRHRGLLRVSEYVGGPNGALRKSPGAIRSARRGRRILLVDNAVVPALW